MSRAATSRLKVNPAIGSRPTLEWCSLTDLAIDDFYQRSVQADNSQALIRRIAQFWDWSLCQPLAVARRGDGALMVVDGQHRLEAARLRRDINQLPCVITSYATAGDEAAAFVALNQQRRPLTALDLFKAAVAAEDQTALAVTKLLADNGLSIAPHSNYTCWKPGMVSNISGILRCYRIHGVKVADQALEALARAFPGVVLRYAGSIFPGIYEFIVAQQPLDVDRIRLAEAVGSFTQAQWKTRILAEQADRACERKAAARWAIASAYGIEQTTIAPMPVAQPAPAFAGMRWCEQCDMRVGGSAAASCRSRYCLLKLQA